MPRCGDQNVNNLRVSYTKTLNRWLRLYSMIKMTSKERQKLDDEARRFREFLKHFMDDEPAEIAKMRRRAAALVVW